MRALLRGQRDLFLRFGKVGRVSTAPERKAFHTILLNVKLPHSPNTKKLDKRLGAVPLSRPTFLYYFVYPIALDLKGSEGDLVFY